MATAASRGWGTGFPDCQRDRCVWITAGGIRLLVRAEVAPIFKGFCDELVQRGYPLGDVADDWGFACRAIRGSTAPSNHSWGLAIDLNATTNPMQSALETDFPAWAVEMGEGKYGLHWGGRYGSRPDAMHWEWLGTPRQAAWLIASLAALPSDDQPPEPPPQEDDMTPEQAATLDRIHWMLEQTKPNADRIPAVQASVDLLAWGVLDPGQGLRTMVAELAGRPVATIDAATIAAAIPANLAQQVADELAERLAG